MVRYEFALILKAAENPVLQKTLSETLNHILSRGNVIRGIESLGRRHLPVQMKDAKGKKHIEGCYFSVDCDMPLEEAPLVKRYLQEHGDTIRATITEHAKIFKPDTCTGWHEPNYFKILDDLERKSKKDAPKPYPKNWQ